MNGYERYMAMVKGEKLDIVPRIPILMHFAAKHIGVTYADFAGNHETMFKANKALVEEFGFDQLDIMSDPMREASAFGAVLEFPQGTTPHCLNPPLRATKNLSALALPDPESSPRLLSALKVIDAYKEYGYKKYSITGWAEGPLAEAADLRGVEGIFLDLFDDPEFVCELMDLCVETAIKFATAQIKHGCDTIGIGDALASQISAEQYKELVLPREKKIVDAIHAQGGLARLHICGNITHLLPHIKELGIDILDCDWMVDIVKAREILGTNVTLAGNLDPVEDVMRSTPREIKSKLREIYTAVGKPYFANAGCEIPDATPIENLMALCEPIDA